MVSAMSSATHGLRGRQYQLMHAHLLQLQDGRCAICQHRVGEIWRWETVITRLVIDHCHRTGKIRGLLCPYCNTHVGNCENGQQHRVEKMTWPVPDYLAKIAAYLDKL
jgi:hypothetical protein